MKWTIDIRARIRDHLDLADLKFCAGCVACARGFAAQVITNDGSRQSLVGDQAIIDSMTQVNVVCRTGSWIVRRAFMFLGDDLLVQDVYLAHHEESHIVDDIVSQLLFGDIIPIDIQTETLSLNAAAVGEFDLEVEFDSFINISLSY